MHTSLHHENTEIGTWERAVKCSVCTPWRGGGGGVGGVVSFIVNLSTSGCELSVSRTADLRLCTELPVPMEWRLNGPSGRSELYGSEKVSCAAANRTTVSWSSGPLPGHL